MNVKQRIIELNFQNTGENAQIDELLISIITKFQLLEPCRYLSEDSDWLNVSMISVEDENFSQAMSIRKSEIAMFGIFNREDMELLSPKTEPEDFYQ